MKARTQNTILWSLSALLAVLFALAGASKLLIDPDAAAAQFQAFGLPAGLAPFIGLCEIAGAVGLLIPRLAGLAASGLALLMLGAVYSHASYDPLAEAIPALVIGALCTYIAYARGLRLGAGTRA